MERAHDPQLQIAERYFLGELTDDEAESFEAHYFECERCAEYVVEELALLESGRHVAARLPAPQRTIAPAATVTPIAEGRRRRAWLPAVAAAVLVMAVGAPLLLRDRATTPSIAFAYPEPLRFSADRGAEAAPLTFAAAALIAVDVEIPASDVPFPRFELTVRDTANGATIDQPLTVTQDRAAEPVILLLRDLPAGSYEVLIEGVREDGKRSPVGREPFEVSGNGEKEGKP